MINLTQQSLSQKIKEFEYLTQQLRSLEKKDQLQFFNKNNLVISFLVSHPNLDAFYVKASDEEKCVIGSILALGLGENVFFGINSLSEVDKPLKHLISYLVELQRFYDHIGGVMGYHLTALKLIEALQNPQTCENEDYTYKQPEGIDVTHDSLQVRKLVRIGIEKIGDIAEMYPVGGAGDRLHLQDPNTGEHLPVAQLQFCGRTLLEGLIRDIQGREYLHYKCFGKQHYTPIVMMTSQEKDNQKRIIAQCEEHQWFGRDPDNFKLINQLLVPMVTIDGFWVMKGPLKPMLKPGGHGVLWKESLVQGVFDWLKHKKRKKVLIRQINNPIGGVDKGVLALEGIVNQPGKTFGFASCFRHVGAPEGMIVVREKKTADGFLCSITNVEYTDFKKCGIEDVPSENGSSYSRFPSNTNILVADIAALEKASKENPVPGMLINMKHVVPCCGEEGVIEKQAGRVESIMQNIADYLVDVFPEPLEGNLSQLQTFLTYNDRKKTISVTKQAFQLDKGMMGTPEGAFYDFLENHRDLLVNYCRMSLPEFLGEKEYLINGPNYIIDFHPAMGILYQVLAQKIIGGKIHSKSEWIMDIGEVYVKNLDLEGSLIVEADSPLGKKDEYGIIHYDSKRCGKCTLINVVVRNAGADLKDPKECYQRTYQRIESTHIVIHGNGEFVAENVTFTGDMFFEVPDKHRLVVYEQNGELAWHHEAISRPTWQWSYSFDDDENIILDRV